MNDKGSTTSIFGLLVGRVKSSVKKLLDKDSKFEYQTKAALAGVAGTPPWFFSFIGGLAEVDLTGDQGDPGSVYVEGSDPNQSRVSLFPGFRTTVGFGGAPSNPFQISGERLRQFNRTMPFHMMRPRGGPDGNEPGGDPGGGSEGDGPALPSRPFWSARYKSTQCHNGSRHSFIRSPAVAK